MFYVKVAAPFVVSVPSLKAVSLLHYCTDDVDKVSSDLGCCFECSGFRSHWQHFVRSTK